MQRASTSTAPNRDTEDTKQADDAADVGVGSSSFSSSLIVTTHSLLYQPPSVNQTWRPNTSTTLTITTPPSPPLPLPPPQNNAPRPPPSQQPPTAPPSSAPAAPPLPPASPPATTRHPLSPTISTPRTSPPGQQQQQQQQHQHPAPTTTTTLHPTPVPSSSHQRRNPHRNDPSPPARNVKGHTPKRDTTPLRRSVSSESTPKG